MLVKNLLFSKLGLNKRLFKLIQQLRTLPPQTLLGRHLEISVKLVIPVNIFLVWTELF